MRDEKISIAVCSTGKSRILTEVLTELNNLALSTDRNIEVLLILNGNCGQIEIPNFVALHCESQIGYANVRNKALRVASASDCLIFIDDDELPTKEWLENLLASHDRFPQDIIVGPVYPIMQSQNSKSFRSKSFNQYSNFQDGDIVVQGGSGNMLIPSAVMQSEYCYFDRFFNNGGEDTDFCFRIKSANFQIRFSSLAVLYEVEIQDKYSASYILGRTVNDAVNYSLIVKRNSSFYAICIRLIKMSLRVIQNYTLHVLAGQSNAKYLSNMAALKALLSGKRP